MLREPHILNNEKYPKFKVSDHARIPNIKAIFTKDYTQKWYKEVCVIKNVKDKVPWVYGIGDLNREEIVYVL